MRSYEFTAKTVEKAIKEGLETLGKKQEDVDIKIINEGGFFKKAKIVINIEDEIEHTNFASAKEEITVVENKQPEVENLEDDIQKAEEVEEKEPEEVIEEVAEEEIQEEVAEEPQQKEKEAEIVEKIEPAKEEITEIEQLDEMEERRRQYAEKHCENNTTSVEFIEGLLKVLRIEGKVNLEEKRDASEIIIESEDAGKVIGYRGECLAGIQYLANIIEGNKNPKAKRVVVDAGDYKTRREESLRALAIRVAGKVEATGRPYKFEPMSAFERRIIHTELHNYSSVETHSEGVEPYRHLIVTKKK